MGADQRASLATGALGLALMLAACTDQRQTAALAGAGAGATAGCGVATATAALAPGCPVGAAVGGAVGGAVGLVVGDEVAARKERYATWYELLDAELASAEEFNRILAERNAGLRAEVDELGRQAARLERSGAGWRERLEAAVSRLEAANRRLEQARYELQVKRALLEEARGEAELDAASLGGYAAAVAELERQFDQFAELIGRYEALRERPDGVR